MRLTFRVDAGPKIGLGHSMRCLALVQFARDKGFNIDLITSNMPQEIQKLYANEAVEITSLDLHSGSTEDVEQTVEFCEQNNTDWLILDGYQFESDYQKKVNEADSFSSLVIDDYAHLNQYYADIILNQNLNAENINYKIGSGATRKLCGVKYALLRREFRKKRQNISPSFDKECNLLITMGGSDPENITAKILRGLDYHEFTNLKITVVLGAANSKVEEIRRLAEDIEPAVELKTHVKQMSNEMRQADLAISSASSTCWELACLKVPMLVVVFAKNQELVASGLADKNAAINLGWFDKLQSEDIARVLKELIENPEKRRNLVNNARGLVDGKGASRVINVLKSEKIDLRLAEEEDCRLLWNWVNDPAVREAAFNTASIPFDDHVEWYEEKLKSSNSYIFIAQDTNSVPIGQIRFDIQGNKVFVDVSVDSKQRGKGFGTAIIRQGAKKIIDRLELNSVHAWVKPENKSSREAFRKSGFNELELSEYEGHTAWHYVLNVNDE